MKIRCRYCGSYINNTDELCKNCGAVNEDMVRTATGVPRTIEELKNFCHMHNLPLEQMRFFIGENYTGARAFGIYRDNNGDFVVYKNKADGTRAIRYKGKDEAYAVNEIYQKMKSEIQKQKAHRANSTCLYRTRRGRTARFIIYNIYMIALLLIVIGMAFKNIASLDDPSNGYYYYGNEYYYNQDDFWYVYDTVWDDWYPAESSVVDTITDYHDSYWVGYEYNTEYDIDSFSDSTYYSPHSYNGSSDSDWDDDWDDSDWDWDSGSDWDTGTTDWDSDW